MTVSNAMTKADWIDTFERHTRALGLFVFHAYVYTCIHRYVRTCDRCVHGACASPTCSNAPMTVSVRVSCHVFPCADRDNMCQGRWFITEFWLGGLWSGGKPFFSICEYSRAWMYLIITRNTFSSNDASGSILRYLTSKQNQLITRVRKRVKIRSLGTQKPYETFLCLYFRGISDFQ